MNVLPLKDCALFARIAPDQLEQLLGCLGAKEKPYKKDAFIFSAGEAAEEFGILVAGGAHVIQEDFWGNRTILAHVEPGELFGEAFSCAETPALPVSVVATGASRALLVDYRRITHTCPSSCMFHSQLISNMLGILAAKNILLTRKMEHISRRTTREKLLSFLSAQAAAAKTNQVNIPFNRQELADYLCVERSALSRELGRMQREGLLEYRKNRFRLLPKAALPGK